MCPVCGLSEAEGLVHVQQDIALNKIASAAADLLRPGSSKHLARAIEDGDVQVVALKAALDDYYSVPVDAEPAIESLLAMTRELNHE